MFFCVFFYPHIFISIKQSNRNLYFIISHFTLYYCIPIKNSQLYMYKIIIIYPLTAKVVGAPQMISQPVSSIFPCSLQCNTLLLQISLVRQKHGEAVEWCQELEETYGRASKLRDQLLVMIQRITLQQQLPGQQDRAQQQVAQEKFH